MKSYSISVLLISMLSGYIYPPTFSSENKVLYKSAEKHFLLGEFEKALPYYKELLLKEDYLKDKYFYYEAGICFLHSKTPAGSIQLLNKAKQLDKSQELKDIAFYLGKANHLNHQFAKAIEYYEKFLETLSSKTRQEVEESKGIIKLIDNCKNGVKYKTDPIPLSITPFSPPINTSYGEYCPVISQDGKTMFFASNRNCGVGGPDIITGRYNEDIYVAEKVNNNWDVSNIGFPINTAYNEAPLALSNDGKVLLFYRDGASGGNAIFYSSKENNTWSDGKILEGEVNDGYFKTGACFSKNGRRLYFSSSRPGGYGGMDLYYSDIKKDSTWGPAINLGPEINSANNEEAPFLKNDTLFFASDGNTSIGGFDIFYSVLTDSAWHKPVNLGLPVNSAYDEIYITFYNNEAIYGRQFQSRYGREDLFKVSFNPEKTEINSNTSGKEVANFDTITASTDNKEVLNENFVSTKHETAEVSDTESTELIKSRTHFPLGVGDYITEYSKLKLEALVVYLSKNPEVKIELRGYADYMGSDLLNKKLSVERAETVKRYLVEKGIKANRITAKGYGVSDLITSTSVEENVVNRRVEVHISE